ncbi:MAG: NAD(P)H-dependent glycerol-3-phosphate dehydrogenase, partial [Bryocella sp.]
MSRIAILGAGAWGTALAVSLARRGGHSISLWVHAREHAERMMETRINARYLPGAVLSADVCVTADLMQAVDGAEVVVFVVPSQHLREVVGMATSALNARQVLLSAAKGVEERTYLRMTQVLSEFAPENAVGVLSGPSFAQEVAAGQPTALVVGCHDPRGGAEDQKTVRRLQEEFTSETLRVYGNEDIIGVEMGGALKNVMALASGVVTGLELGSNAAAALITRGLAEMTRLSVACGGRQETLAGLAGMGDLVLTCTGAMSRTRAVGVELGKGKELAEILAGLQGKVAEGVRTTSAALGLAARYGVEMPIAEQMQAILFGGREPQEAIRE